ncbi:MAG: putative transcriptional regulator, PucR family [Frankiales bacterium]|nr:putative transcriptional regulator, PucR family [Frankiales bacterium]
MTDRLVESILSEDPSYGLGRTTREDLRYSCHDNLERILQTLQGEAPRDDVFDAPHATGHRRAEQGIPLESVLHAYRLGHRGIWDALVAQARDAGAVDGLVEAASHVWELVDSFSSEVARAYRDTERVLHRRDDRRRDALLDALLEGRGRERSMAAEAAGALDLPEHGRYVVLVLDGTANGRPVADALAVRGLRAAWRARADREIGLIALGRWTVDDLEKGLGHVASLRAGLSPVVEGLAEVDAAHRLAETALRALPPTHAGINALDARLPGALLVTAPDLSARLVERALGGVLVLDREERDLLLETLATWLHTGGSAGQTAARLYCHRNTVLNRLRRLEALTGRSLERVDDLVEWSLALLAREVLPDDTLP